MNDFAFTKDDEREIEEIVKNYPQGRQASAVMPLLTLAQKRGGGFLTKEAMNEVARKLAMSPTRVYEVAHFYSLYHHAPVGQTPIYICTSVSCWLRGADKIMKKAQSLESEEVSVHEAQCLGACVNAPVAMMGGCYHEELDEKAVTLLMTESKNGS